MKESRIDELVKELSKPENIVKTTEAIDKLMVPVYNGRWWYLTREIVAYKCRIDSTKMQMKDAVRHYAEKHYGRKDQW